MYRLYNEAFNLHECLDRAYWIAVDARDYERSVRLVRLMARVMRRTKRRLGVRETFYQVA